MKILYFAWLRTKTGCAQEELSPPAHVSDVAALVEWLKQRSPGHAEALTDLSAVRAAVNQEFVAFDQALAADDEVALFPPVTGG